MLPRPRLHLPPRRPPRARRHQLRLELRRSRALRLRARARLPAAAVAQQQRRRLHLEQRSVVRAQRRVRPIELGARLDE